MSKILLVVGHQKSAQGAVNRELSISEWEFNSRLVPMIAERLGDMAVVLNRDIPHWKKAPVINDPRGQREREEYEKAGLEKTREIQPERKPLS